MLYDILGCNGDIMCRCDHAYNAYLMNKKPENRLLKKYRNGSEKWRIYIDYDDDGIYEGIDVISHNPDRKRSMNPIQKFRLLLIKMGLSYRCPFCGSKIRTKPIDDMEDKIYCLGCMWNV